MGPLPENYYSALLRICTLPKLWLAMDVCSASDIPAFRQHATIVKITCSSNMWHFWHFSLWDLDEDAQQKNICVTIFSLFDVLTAVTVKISVFLCLMSCTCERMHSNRPPFLGLKSKRT
jgi:hypothetical protein